MLEQKREICILSMDTWVTIAIWASLAQTEHTWKMYLPPQLHVANPENCIEYADKEALLLFLSSLKMELGKQPREPNGAS